MEAFKMRILRVAVIIIVNVWIVLSAVGQTPISTGSQAASSQPVAAPSAPADTTPAPIWVTYHFFFFHVENLDRVAAEEDAKGKEGGKWRTHDQRAAGLSEEEGKILHQKAHDCNQEVNNTDAKLQARVRDFHGQIPNEQIHDIASLPELDQLWQQRIQIINSYVDRLRSMLGEESFQKLDSYVRSNFQPVKVHASGAPASVSKSNPGDPQ
jgi:hypothetical protein